MNAGQHRHRSNDYLVHMLDAIQLARSDVEVLEKTEFLDDRKTQQAVILNILILGEAANKLANEYPQFVAAHTEIPYSSVCMERVYDQNIRK